MCVKPIFNRGVQFPVRERSRRTQQMSTTRRASKHPTEQLRSSLPVGQGLVDEISERAAIGTAGLRRSLDHLDRDQLFRGINPKRRAPGAGPVVVSDLLSSLPCFFYCMELLTYFTAE